MTQIDLLGNLTRDPEIKFTNEGTAICEIGLAVSRRWAGRKGKESETVDFLMYPAGAEWRKTAQHHPRKD